MVETKTSIDMTNNSDHESSMIHFTRVRHTISPYLPPPVLNLMSSIDSNPSMQNMIGDEPSMVLFVALLTIALMGKVIKLFSLITSGKAVEGLDDDAPEGHVLSELDKAKSDGKQEESYDDSVVLFGPSNSGKSVLFHTLISSPNKKDGDQKMKLPNTVMSLKANVSVVKNETGENGGGNSAAVRLVDYPGHVTLSSHLSSLLTPTTNHKNSTIRGLLVIDSTKSVSDAAALLYHTVLTNAKLLDSWEKKKDNFHIMVVCSKADETKTKNWRRIKIQLKTELEKLKKISSSVASGSVTMEGTASNEMDTSKREMTGKNVNLDDLSKNGLPMIQLSFVSVSCSSMIGFDALKSFVTSGEILTDNSSILSNAKI